MRNISHEILLDDQIKKNENGVACGKYGGEEASLQVLVGETRRTEIAWSRCENNIKVDLKEIG
jgi:hypothetical protein